MYKFKYITLCASVCRFMKLHIYSCACTCTYIFVLIDKLY